MFLKREDVLGKNLQVIKREYKILMFKIDNKYNNKCLSKTNKNQKP